MRKLDLLLFAILAGLLLLLIGLGAYFSLKSQDITEKDLKRSVATRIEINQIPQTPEDTAHVMSPQSAAIQKDMFEYHIIIGSFKTLAEAKQYADKKRKSLEMDIDVLPAENDHCYRVSCGKYPVLREAEANLGRVQASIRSDAWILAVK